MDIIRKGRKDFKCILCEKRTKPGKRRPLCGEANKNLRNFLSKSFLVLPNDDDVICDTCRRKYYREEQAQVNTPTVLTTDTNTNDPDFMPPSAPKRAKLSSPLSISLPISSTIKGHAQCCLCKKRGPKLMVVPQEARFNTFLEKNIIIPAGSRCCPRHLCTEGFTKEANEDITSVYTVSDFNRSGLLELIDTIREHALKNKNARIDFDKSSSLNDTDFRNLTGLTITDFEDLCSHIPNSAIRDTRVRSMRTCIGIFLTKLRSGMSNKILATLFNISKDSIRKAISSARDAVKQHFAPKYLGFDHVSRESVIQNHTRPLAQTLFGDITNTTAILVIDGTYIYIQKSGQFKFQRSTYSMHKYRNLIKPMMFVTTTGYIVSVIGPYLCNSKNNDAKILNSIFKNNLEKIKEWFETNDVVVVDRGFRDSIDLLEEFGIQIKMPSFLKRNEKQLSVEDGNTTRLVTKIRWVVESVNGRIKQWRLLDKVLPNSLIPYAGEYTRFVSAICNKYRPPLNSGNETEDLLLGTKMLHMSKKKNELMERVSNENLHSRSGRWQKIDGNDSVEDFPKLSEDDIRDITLGVYQLKLAKSYTEEHLENDEYYEVMQQGHQLIRVRMASRHTSSKSHNLWITYDDCCIKAWYCTCKAGARIVGTCSHISSVIWFLSFYRHQSCKGNQAKQWRDYVHDANQPEVIDDSDSEPEE
ncbi:uncharacterized protein LOC127726916 [Mytilus californianus]|uniref:uncharacterized protein LOC127726916 n=1 Tax=Mytilus californianus TaxID=6549 RepID=UPI0022472724|nr:uncharacterized protein LOC127726916 [Mytilus californianus]